MYSLPNLRFNVLKFSLFVFAFSQMLTQAEARGLLASEVTKNYEVNSKSLVPFLFGDKTKHRDWLYSFRSPEQFIRGVYVLKDGQTDGGMFLSDKEESQ